MKRYFRLFTLILSLVLAFALFSSCSNEGEVSESPGVKPTETTGTQEPAESSEPEPVDEYVYRMPITDSPYTVSAWMVFTSTRLSSPNEVLANIELEKRTNIHVDYKTTSYTDQDTAFNLLITSGDFTDMIFLGTNGGVPTYNGGFDKGLEDGVFIELTDAVNKWMPNLKSYMDQNDEIRKQLHTDEGNIVAIACIQNGYEPAWVGPGIRKDLLEKAGISKLPETYEELYIALTKFKNELGVEIPMAVFPSGYNGMSHALTAGYDVAPDFFNQHGTVKFGFIEPGFKEWLAMMNKWYNEGLISRDYYTNTDFTGMQSIPSGKAAATDFLMFTLADIYKMLSGDPEFHFTAIPIPRKNASYIAHFRRFNEITGQTGIALSTAVSDAEKLEIMARWIDYRFTEEGALLLNYGIEGDTYTLVDGKPQFTEKVFANPEGISPNDMIDMTTDSRYGALYDWTRTKQTVSEEAWGFYDVWSNSSSGDWVMPPITLTSDEGSEFSSIYGDIQTLIGETIVQFITGAKPLSEYDAFAEQIKSMGIDRCIEIQQAALDRYLAR